MPTAIIIDDSDFRCLWIGYDVSTGATVGNRYLSSAGSQRMLSSTSYGNMIYGTLQYDGASKTTLFAYDTTTESFMTNYQSYSDAKILIGSSTRYQNFTCFFKALMLFMNLSHPM